GDLGHPVVVFVPKCLRALGAFLIIHDDADSERGVIGPSDLRRIRPIADEVTWRARHLDLRRHAAPASVVKHCSTISSSVMFGLRSSLTGRPGRNTITRSHRFARSSYSMLAIKAAPPPAAKSRMRAK